MRLRMISAQPATDYYAWQVEAYLHNFIQLGYNGNYIDVVASYDNFIPVSWRIIQDKFPFVRFFYYKDTREDKIYAPSIQSHILEKHFKEHKYLSKEAIFFHDCDFIFTRHFDFSPYLNDDKWYFSDTISYIGAEYIKSKGVLEKMCEIADISVELVESNQNNSGGAQKLMKNVTAEYWSEVYEMSNKLYKGMSNQSTDLQIWCASMWAELWTAWKKGIDISVPKEFDFCWATCPIERWNHVPFFHNAGVIDDKQGMFFKGNYIEKHPREDNLELDNNRCSYLYYNFIKSSIFALWQSKQ